MNIYQQPLSLGSYLETQRQAGKNLKGIHRERSIPCDLLVKSSDYVDNNSACVRPSVPLDAIDCRIISRLRRIIDVPHPCIPSERWSDRFTKKTQIKDNALDIDPKAAVVSRRKPPWNVLSHKPPQNF